MKNTHPRSALLGAFLSLLAIMGASADTVVMSSGRTMPGNAIQTNGDDVLILMKCAAFDFSKASIKEIRPEPAQLAEPSAASRLPDFQKAVLSLSRQPWATNLTPIPATVIDRGILRNVPYASFHCGADYEVNVYGDPESPAGIEIGVYRKLLDDGAAKGNCIGFVSGLLGESADRQTARGLDLGKDLKTSGGLTFEITPPSAQDSYGGWWISVYSEKQLNLARASDGEMEAISMTQADAAKDSQASTNFASWSADELKQARPASKETISFYNTSGVLITNAEVVRIIDGVSMVWRTGPTSGGMIRLADLPEDLRTRFGYDEAKTKAADDLAKANRTQWQQEAVLAAQAAQAAVPPPDYSPYGISDYSGGGYSGGGRVYVHGYTRANGTYVQPYTRSYPHRR